MSNEITPINSTTPGNRSSCMRAVGISCLVVIVTGIAFTLFAVTMVSKNPMLRRVYTEAQHISLCETNLREIGGALDRYSRRNGKYPNDLADMYPKFMEKKEILHCPSDSRPKNTVSYDYKLPSMDAPSSTLVIECKRHIVMKDQPPWMISLNKDGKVIRKAPSVTATGRLGDKATGRP